MIYALVWKQARVNIDGLTEQIAEWIMHLYSALLSIAVHPKALYIMWGGGVSSTTTTSLYEVV